MTILTDTDRLLDAAASLNSLQPGLHDAIMTLNRLGGYGVDETVYRCRQRLERVASIVDDVATLLELRQRLVTTADTAAWLYGDSAAVRFGGVLTRLAATTLGPDGQAGAVEITDWLASQDPSVAADIWNRLPTAVRHQICSTRPGFVATRLVAHGGTLSRHEYDLVDDLNSFDERGSGTEIGLEVGGGLGAVVNVGAGLAVARHDYSNGEVVISLQGSGSADVGAGADVKLANASVTVGGTIDGGVAFRFASSASADEAIAELRREVGALVAAALNPVTVATGIGCAGFSHLARISPWLAPPVSCRQPIFDVARAGRVLRRWGASRESGTVGATIRPRADLDAVDTKSSVGVAMGARLTRVRADGAHGGYTAASIEVSSGLDARLVAPMISGLDPLAQAEGEAAVAAEWRRHDDGAQFLVISASGMGGTATMGQRRRRRQDVEMKIEITDENQQHVAATVQSLTRGESPMPALRELYEQTELSVVTTEQKVTSMSVGGVELDDVPVLDELITANTSETTTTHINRKLPGGGWHSPRAVEQILDQYARNHGLPET